MLALALAATPALAQTGPTPANPAARPVPRSIGVWSDWEAFASQEAGAAVCYLVSHPFSAIPAAEKGGLTLTVARRPRRPDMVTLAAGSADISGTTAALRMGAQSFPLETGPDGAFVRDATAVVAAMKRKLQAVANFEGPQGARATATYSLRGFRAAYEATRRMCPER